MMKNISKSLSILSVLVAMIMGVAVTADAQRRNERDIRDAVRSLRSGMDDFEANLRYQMQSNSTGADDMRVASDDVRNMRDAIARFQENYDRRRENRDDVKEIVEAARRVDQFLQNSPQNRRVTDDWAVVRRQLDRLGASYGLSTAWDSEPSTQYPRDNPPYPVTTNTPANIYKVGLSGSYELDTTRSESIDDIVADTSLGAEQRDDLKEKLIAPQQISIDLRGNQVTLSTSNASPITIVADGRDKVERSPSGKTVRRRATLRGDVLTVSSLGGETDYTITFTSLSNGQGMRVSRRITTEYLRQTVIAESLYNKSGTTADIRTGTGSATGDPNGGYSDNDQSGSVYNGGSPSGSVSRPGNYYVPNGTVITGMLENEIDTKTSQNNDRFRLTVQSPNEYRGATVEGYLSGVGNSGRVSGNSNVTFNFERITLRNGKTYDFAGTLQTIKDDQGKTVQIDNEGTARGDSQTRQTVTRGGIGAGIGAIIGAIAGGGKGAAIGAVIGGGAGAGSVIVQGKDGIRLMPGSTITVQSSAPTQYGPR
jgi:hypothetical protein